MPTLVIVRVEQVVTAISYLAECIGPAKLIGPKMNA